MAELDDRDVRPLTKAEREQLASLLFRLFEAIHNSQMMQDRILRALHDNAGIRVDVAKDREAYVGNMSRAVDLIDSLTASFGVSGDG